MCHGTYRDITVRRLPDCTDQVLYIKTAGSIFQSLVFRMYKFAEESMLIRKVRKKPIN